jgi:hypothetical protein
MGTFSLLLSIFFNLEKYQYAHPAVDWTKYQQDEVICTESSAGE